MRGGGILGVIVLVWLVIGVLAAYQRDYFKTEANNCATAGTIASDGRCWAVELRGGEPEGDQLQPARAQPVTNGLRPIHH